MDGYGWCPPSVVPPPRQAPGTGHQARAPLPERGIRTEKGSRLCDGIQSGSSIVPHNPYARTYRHASSSPASGHLAEGSPYIFNQPALPRASGVPATASPPTPKPASPPVTYGSGEVQAVREGCNWYPRRFTLTPPVPEGAGTRDRPGRRSPTTVLASAGRLTGYNIPVLRDIDACKGPGGGGGGGGRRPRAGGPACPRE